MDIKRVFRIKYYRVSDYFDTKNLSNYSKNLYWLRRGYVEEIFKF